MLNWLDEGSNLVFCPLLADEPEIDVEKAQQSMKDVLQSDRVDHPKLVRLQRDTYMSRRKFLQTLPNCDIHSIVEAYPILKEERYMEKEFEIMLPSKTMVRLIDRFDEVFTQVDRVLNKNSSEDDGDDVFEICQQLSDEIKLQGQNAQTYKPLLVNRSVSLYHYVNRM